MSGEGRTPQQSEAATTIVRKSKLLVLKRLEIPEPVPIRPHGYFADCDNKAEAKASNKLGARSARKIVK